MSESPPPSPASYSLGTPENIPENVPENIPENILEGLLAELPDELLGNDGDGSEHSGPAGTPMFGGDWEDGLIFYGATPPPIDGIRSVYVPPSDRWGESPATNDQAPPSYNPDSPSSTDSAYSDVPAVLTPEQGDDNVFMEEIWNELFLPDSSSLHDGVWTAPDITSDSVRGGNDGNDSGGGAHISGGSTSNPPCMYIDSP